MGERLEITVNGKAHPYTAGMTLAALLDALSHPATSVVAEVNGEIIPRGAFDATPLNADDTIEIIHFVGGG